MLDNQDQIGFHGELVASLSSQGDQVIKESVDSKLLPQILLFD